MSMSKRWFALIPTAVLSVAVLAGCGRPGEIVREEVTRVSGVPNEPRIEATPEVAQETGSGNGATASQEITVTSYDIYFDPKEVTIPADTDVRFLLPNQGAAPHNFAIDELGISVDQAPGVLDYETVINAPAGEYEYYCNVPGHKEAGMVGTLTAE
jgi:uncharacterized cupredoxin-like copper-binding protein